MSMQSKIVTAAATLALAAGVGAAGTLPANAATSACGTNCVNWFSAAYGTAAHPAFVLNVRNQVASVGQQINLAAASGANQGEDFEAAFQGKVSDFVAAGLMNPGLGSLYGNLSVDEFQYAPGNSPTGLCVGVATTPAPDTAVTLQPCGATARTTWILDPVTTSAGSFDALINGATDSNFSEPFSLTALRPLPLFTSRLRLDVHSQAVLNHQLWANVPGALPVP
jgi:hypothetical protein